MENPPSKPLLHAAVGFHFCVVFPKKIVLFILKEGKKPMKK